MFGTSRVSSRSAGDGRLQRLAGLHRLIVGEHVRGQRDEHERHRNEQPPLHMRLHPRTGIAPGRLVRVIVFVGIMLGMRMMRHVDSGQGERPK